MDTMMSTDWQPLSFQIREISKACCATVEGGLSNCFMFPMPPSLITQAAEVVTGKKEDGELH